MIKDPDYFSAPHPPNQLGPAHWQDKFTNIEQFIGNSSVPETIHLSGASNQYTIENYGVGIFAITGTFEREDNSFWLINIGNLVCTDKIIQI